MAYRTSRPLRFGDCDPSGIAYFPSYLDLLVGVVEDFFAELGFAWHDLVGRDRIGTPTLKLDILFSHPGFQGDRLDFTLRVVGLGRSSLELDHVVESGGRRLWACRQKLVATSLETHRSTAWPDALRAALTAHLEEP